MPVKPQCRMCLPALGQHPCWQTLPLVLGRHARRKDEIPSFAQHHFLQMAWFMQNTANSCIFQRNNQNGRYDVWYNSPPGDGWQFRFNVLVSGCTAHGCRHCSSDCCCGCAQQGGCPALPITLQRRKSCQDPQRYSWIEQACTYNIWRCGQKTVSGGERGARPRRLAVQRLCGPAELHVSLRNGPAELPAFYSLAFHLGITG